MPLLKPKGGKTLWIVSLVALLVAGGLGALYYFHLPPFSPPPKPIVETPVPPVVTERQVKPTEPVEAKPAEPVEGQARPSRSRPSPPSRSKPQAGRSRSRPSRSRSAKAKEKADKLVQKGRAAPDRGSRAHRARAVQEGGEAGAGKDGGNQASTSSRRWASSGKAEILLEGKGSLTIDGHKFAAPRKLKLPAGPHTIDSGDGADRDRAQAQREEEAEGARSERARRGPGAGGGAGTVWGVGAAITRRRPMDLGGRAGRAGRRWSWPWSGGVLVFVPGFFG